MPEIPVSNCEIIIFCLKSEPLSTLNNGQFAIFPRSKAAIVVPNPTDPGDCSYLNDVNNYGSEMESDVF